MPKNQFPLSLLTAIAVVLVSVPAAPAADIAMVKDLVGGLGVTPQQATGGAKALFDLAKTNLGADDYAKLAQSVPEVATLMGAAADPAKTASTAASTAATAATTTATAAADSAATAAKTEAAAASADGKQAATKAESSASSAASALLAAAGAGGGLGDLGKLTSNAGLISKFAELGLKPEMIGKFAPILFKNALSSGGPAAAGLLKKGLGL